MKAPLGDVPAAPRRHLAGRVAWVTGGASGMGRACALALAGSGADVAIGSLLQGAGRRLEWFTYRPSHDELTATREMIEAEGVRAFAGPLDVRSVESVEGFHAAAVDTLGAIDILVNVAGIFGAQPIAGHDDALWQVQWNRSRVFTPRRRQSTSTSAAPTARSKRCLPGMIERGWGRIVNIASTSANVGHAGSGAYSASKAGLLGLTRCVALEGAPHGVTCNAINPGQIDTGLTRVSFARRPKTEYVADSVEEYFAAWAAGQPQKRFIETYEIGALAAFLCREEAAGITMEDITVSGGTLY